MGIMSNNAIINRAQGADTLTAHCGCIYLHTAKLLEPCHTVGAHAVNRAAWDNAPPVHFTRAVDPPHLLTSASVTWSRHEHKASLIDTGPLCQLGRQREKKKQGDRQTAVQNKISPQGADRTSVQPEIIQCSRNPISLRPFLTAIFNLSFIHSPWFSIWGPMTFVPGQITCTKPDIFNNVICLFLWCMFYSHVTDSFFQWLNVKGTWYVCQMMTVCLELICKASRLLKS